jgi:prepilin-type processing-associated H-X9-DG protein
VLIGAGGQFGGYFPQGANFAMCDGSVRMITPQISREVLLQLATIDEGAGAVIPEE